MKELGKHFFEIHQGLQNYLFHCLKVNGYDHVIVDKDDYYKVLHFLKKNGVTVEDIEKESSEPIFDRVSLQKWEKHE